MPEMPGVSKETFYSINSVATAAAGQHVLQAVSVPAVQLLPLTITTFTGLQLLSHLFSPPPLIPQPLG